MKFDELYNTIKEHPSCNVVLKVPYGILRTLIPNIDECTFKYCNVVLEQGTANLGYTRAGKVLHDAPVLTGFFFINQIANKHISDEEFKVLQKYTKLQEGVAVTSFVAYNDDSTEGIELQYVCDKSSCGF